MFKVKLCKKITNLISILLTTIFIQSMVLESFANNNPIQIVSNPGEDFAGSVSRDEKAIVYVSQKSGNLDLWLKKLEPAPPPDRQLTFHNSGDNSPAISPNGEWLAFISNRSDPKGDLYILPLKFAAPQKGIDNARRLTDGKTQDKNPTWSADGKFIYFSSKSSGSFETQIKKIDIDTKIETGIDKVQGLNPSVSHDGRYLAFVSQKRNMEPSIWVKDLKTNSLVQITKGKDIDVSPNWSPDGKEIYFVRYRDDTNRDSAVTIEDRPNIWSISFPPSKLPVQLTDSTAYDLFPQASKNSLYITSDRKKDINIWKIPKKGLIPFPNDYGQALQITADLCPKTDQTPYSCLMAYNNLIALFSDEGGSTRSNYLMGLGYLSLGHVDYAEKIFSRIAKNKQKNALYRGLAEIENLILQTEKFKTKGNSEYLKKAAQTLVDFNNIKIKYKDERRVSSKILLEKGRILFKTKEINKALKFYKETIKNYPEQRTISAEAAFLQNEIYQTLGDNQKVINSFIQVVRDFYDVEYWTDKATREIFALHEDQPTLEKKASKLHDLSIQYEKLPRLAGAIQNRVGELYRQGNENLLAKEAYQATVNRFPNSTKSKNAALFALANIYAEEEDFEQSLRVYEQIADDSKDLKEAVKNSRKGYIRKSVAKGKWELKVGEVKLAVKTFLNLILFSTETIEGHRGFVQAKAALKGIDETISFYKDRLKKNPDSAPDRYALGLTYTYLEKPDLDMAEKEIREAIRTDSQQIYYHQTLGYVYEQMESILKRSDYLERALQEYQTALSLADPTETPRNEADLLLNLGNGNFLLNNFSTAYRYYKRREETGLDFLNESREAIYFSRYGESTFKFGSPKEAIKTLKKSLKIFSKKKDQTRMAELNDRIALAYQDVENYSEAVNHFTEAMEINRASGNTSSLSRSLRNIANNLFWLNKKEKTKKSGQLTQALNNYFEAIEKIEKFGVIQKKKNQSGLLNIQIETPLDQNASAAASGFDTVGEQKLIFHYVGKIYGDFKEYGRATKYFEKKLALIPDKLDIEKNVPVLLEKALLQNQIGNFNYLKGDYEAAGRYFKNSYQLSKSLKNRHGTAVNAANLGKLLLAKLENRPTAQPFQEIESTISLLTETSKWLAEFKEYSNPEYQAYLQNYIGIFKYYKTLQLSNTTKPLSEKNDSISFLSSLNDLKNEVDNLNLAAQNFKEAIKNIEAAKDIPQKKEMLAALKQNLKLTKNFENSAKKTNSNTAPTDPAFSIRWQHRYLKALQSASSKEKLSLFLESEKLFSKIPYGFSPLKDDGITMLAQLYQDITAAYFEEKRFAEALFFSEKGSRQLAIANHQIFPKNFSNEDRQMYWDELKTFPDRLRKAVEGTSEEDAKSILEEQEEFLTLVKEDDKELAALYTPYIPDINEIRSSMKKEGAILKYEWIGEKIFIWVINSKIIRAGAVTATSELTRVISQYAANPKSYSRLDIELLSRALTEPIKDFVKNSKALYILANGPLEFLPWPAMKINAKSIVETIPITYISSFSHLIFSKEKRNLYNASLLNIGNSFETMKGLGSSFSTIKNLNSRTKEIDAFPKLRRNFGLINIENRTVLNGRKLWDSYIGISDNPRRFDRWRPQELFEESLSGHLIALQNIRSDYERGNNLSPSVFLTEALTFAGFPGVLLNWTQNGSIAQKSLFKSFLKKVPSGNPSEALRFAQLETAKKFPDSLDWAGYRFYGFPGMDEDEKKEFAKTYFDTNVQKGLQTFKQKEWDSSIRYFENALALISFLENKNSENQIRKTLALAAYNQGDYQKAIQYQKGLVKMMELREDPELLAESIYFLGILHSRAENYGEAVKLLQKSLNIYKENEILDKLAESYSTLGIIEENALDYDKALQAFSSSLKISEEIGEDLNRGRELRRIGRIFYLRLNRYDRAKAYFQQAYDLFMEIEQLDQVVETLLELGLVAEKQGDFDVALNRYREAQVLAKKIDMKPGLSKAFLYQANSHWFQGNYQKAFKFQQKALAIAEEITDKRQKIFVFNTLGLIYWTLNNSSQALGNLNKSLKLAEEIESPLDIATAYNNIGLVYRKDKKYEKSIEFFQKALKKDEELKSKWGQGYTHRNLGMSYLRLDQLDFASIHIQKAVALSREIGNQTNLVKSMLEMGNLAMKRKNCSKAISAFKETEALAGKLKISEVHWRALRGQGKCLAMHGNLNPATEAYKKSAEIVEDMRAAIKIEEFKNGFLTDKQDVFKELVLLLLDQNKTAEAFSYAEKAKSRSFIDLLGNQKVSLKNDVSQKLYDSLTKQKNQIRKIEETLGKTEEEDKRNQLLNDLVTSKNNYQEILIKVKEQSPQLSSFVTVETLNISEIQKLLEPKVALIEYLTTPKELVIWVVSQNSLQVTKVPIEEKELEKLVNDYRNRMQNLAPLEEQTGKLYDIAIKPIEPWIQTQKTLGIIPNGILHYISFSSLRGPNGYLFEKHPLFYAPSASVLKFTFGRKYEKKSGPVKVLALSNPDLGSLNYDLPLAELEANAIKWDFPKIDVLTREKATESWLKKHISEYQIIHIASHGEFDPINPLFSSLKLTRDQSEDGNFEVNEVFSLDIKADLVTLSACQTGLGKIEGGDELMGLNRAFFYAGTHALISSLWRVSDISTAILIKHFYRNYATNLKAESLRKAQLLVKQSYQHPAYWSAFSLTGDYR
jgi:CHAT domain-containing protein/Tfp pilus assembly protein PilF